VDEVLAVGDAEFQKKCLGKMGDVASQEGRTVLFVSHNMAAIQRLCKKSTLFLSGNLAAQGYSEEVIHHYLLSFDNDSKYDLKAFTNQNIKIGIRVLNNKNEITRIWQFDTDLTIEIIIDSKITINNPSVDISFYDGNTRIFSLQSDLISGSPKVIYGKCVISFQISNPGFVGAEMHFDVGLRQGKSDYFVLLREAGRISPDYNLLPKNLTTNYLLRPKTTLTWKNADEK
jgi:ABC-type microcin C transport system duplicated ATPase subunit YejF